MNSDQMQALLGSLDCSEHGEPVAKRIRTAGIDGLTWVWGNHPTLLRQGFDDKQIKGMANAACLVACELQVLVEINAGKLVAY